MNDTVAGRAQASIGATARNVAGSVQEATSQVLHTASGAQGGATEMREMIRAQPLTAALLMFAFGYFLGRLGSLIPSRRTQ